MLCDTTKHCATTISSVTLFFGTSLAYPTHQQHTPVALTADQAATPGLQLHTYFGYYVVAKAAAL
jgi:hypothetical protein